MDVDSFIARHTPEWKRLDAACAGGARGLARLAGPEIDAVVRLYLQASAHLSEVRARYRDPRLEAYLNSLVARAHAAIYSARSRTLAGLVRLFGSRYREAMGRTAPFVLVAAAVLLGVTALMLVWVAGSREAEAGLLPAFVRERIRDVGGRRPDIGVDPASLSTLILVNNVRVALLAFALGITLGAGTVWVLVQNGVLIGALAGAYHAAGRAGQFWSLVLPHGFLEIMAIAIAAGAGLRMGWSIVEPGDRSRARALAEESRDAVLVVTGVVPAFLVAAVIEGFVTGSGLPDLAEVAAGAAVALLYLAFLLGRTRRAGGARRRTPITAARAP